jgi:hypothetical protein
MSDETKRVNKKEMKDIIKESNSSIYGNDFCQIIFSVSPPGYK